MLHNTGEPGQVSACLHAGAGSTLSSLFMGFYPRVLVHVDSSLSSLFLIVLLPTVHVLERRVYRCCKANVNSVFLQSPLVLWLRPDVVNIVCCADLAQFGLQDNFTAADVRCLVPLWLRVDGSPTGVCPYRILLGGPFIFALFAV